MNHHSSSSCILDDHTCCRLDYERCGCLCHRSDSAITAEYYRRLRAKKAVLVAAGGPTGGWKKGRPRNPTPASDSAVADRPTEP